MEQLANESSKAYAAFLAYCEMGSQRSLEKLCQECAKSLPILKRWSSHHRWQERIRQYDAAIAAERAEILRQQRRAEIERLRSDTQADAENLRTLARNLSDQLAQAIQDLAPGKIEPRHMASILRTIAQALEAATNLDAAALGIDEALKGEAE